MLFAPQLVSHSSRLLTSTMDQFACATDQALQEAERTVSLPTEEELRAKEALALQKLQAFVASHGAVLPEGWSVKIRVRLTQRRRGSFGRTSDNFYHTPCGSQVFRNYRQVAQFLGLPDPDAARGKRGPEARMQPPAAAAVTAATSHATTTSSQSAGTQLHGAAPGANCGNSSSNSNSSGLNSASSGSALDDQAESQSPLPPAKKARTKAMLVARFTAAPASLC